MIKVNKKVEGEIKIYLNSNLRKFSRINLKEELENVNNQIAQAKREYNLEKAAELQYGRLPQIEKQIEEAEAKAKKDGSDDSLVHENVTEEEIWNSCKTVGVDHFIKTLPGGLHSEIGDTDTVSGGEKQLLTIARGMLEDAPFLILDEATSNVDTRTEELVQQAMDKLTEGKTSFIIAHRLSTIKNADIILVMKDGNIIETGNHEELIAQNGFYADLYNSQFEL